MNEFIEEDVRIKQAMSEGTDLPPVVREKMDRLYAALPELAQERRRYDRHRRRSLGAGIALLLAIVVAAGFVSPTTSGWLRQLKGDVFTTAGLTGMKLSEPSDFPRIAVTDQGLKLTLSEVVYDGVWLSVALVHDSGIQIVPGPDMIGINGRTTAAGMSSTYRSLDESTDETTLTFSSLTKLEDEFDLMIRVNQVVDSRDGAGKKVAGQWTFNTTIRNWRTNVREIVYSPPLHAVADDGIEVTVTGVTISPLTATVTYERIWPEKDAEEAVAPENRTSPAEGERKLDRQLVFRLFDDTGIELEPLTSSGRREGTGPTTYTSAYALFHPDAKELRLSVDEKQILLTSDGKGGYTGSTSTESETVPLMTELPRTIEFVSASITFLRVEFGEEKTIVDYEVKGDYPYQETGWWVENSDQSVVCTVDASKVTRLGNDGYSYRAELPALPNPSELSIRAIRSGPSRYPIPELTFVLPL